MLGAAGFEFDKEYKVFKVKIVNVFGEARVVPLEATVHEADDRIQVNGGVNNCTVEALAVEVEDVPFENKVLASGLNQEQLAGTEKNTSLKTFDTH